MKITNGIKKLVENTVRRNSFKKLGIFSAGVLLASTFYYIGHKGTSIEYIDLSNEYNDLSNGHIDLSKDDYIDIFDMDYGPKDFQIKDLFNNNEVKYVIEHSMKNGIYLDENTEITLIVKDSIKFNHSIYDGLKKFLFNK